MTALISTSTRLKQKLLTGKTIHYLGVYGIALINSEGDFLGEVLIVRIMVEAKRRLLHYLLGERYVKFMKDTGNETKDPILPEPVRLWRKVPKQKESRQQIACLYNLTRDSNCGRESGVECLV